MVVFRLVAEMERVGAKLGIVNQSIAARSMLVIDSVNPGLEEEARRLSCSDSSPSDVDSLIGLDYTFGSGDGCKECPDCRLGTPLHLRTGQLKERDEQPNKAESESSFSDSAIYSVASKDHLRQTLV